MAAADAGSRTQRQAPVVLCRQGIPRTGQVIILVDEAHVQAGGAGLAVVAVDAGALRVSGGEGADDGVVPLRLPSPQKAQDPFQIRPVSDTGQHRQDAGLVQGVLDALIFRQGLTEGRGTSIQQLSAGKGLHPGDAHALRLAPAVKGHPLRGAAVGILAVLIVVAGVDAEHHHVRQAGVQHLPGQGRRMGGEADVADDALGFQRLQKLKNAVVHIPAPVAGLVHTVDEAVVDVVRPQLLQLPRYRPLDGLQIRGPAVRFTGGVIGAEVDLVEHLPAHTRKGGAEDGEAGGVGSGQVEVVDPLLQGHLQRGGTLFRPGGGEAAGAHAQDADPVPGAAVDTVFHRSKPSFPVAALRQPESGRRASHDPIIPPEMRNSEYLFSMLRHTFHTYHTCGPTAAMIW